VSVTGIGIRETTVTSVAHVNHHVSRRVRMTKVKLEVERLEERVAPSATGNPGNNNPPLNNTNNPGNEGTGGQVSTGP
jgi:hypothetical protein